MKFAAQVLVVALVGGLLQTFFPWWTMAIGAFVVGFIFASPGWKSFFAGLVGVGLLWFAMSFYIDSQTQSILTEKVARLFPTKTVPLLFVVTAFIGGLVGGFASLTGSVLSYRKKSRW
jgi:cell division protein FtsX